MNGSYNRIMASLGVLGAGAWGTVIASLLARNGHQLTLWTRRAEQAQHINDHGENQAYVPGLSLQGVWATADLGDLASSQAVFVAVPSQGLREVLAACPLVPGLISCSKGLEFDGFKRFSQIIQEYQPRAHLAALSGPNLAKEIAAGKPAAATVAGQDAVFVRLVQSWLNQGRFRVYGSEDIIGLEIAGALKNVIALAAGLSDGLALGDNAKATLITRGLNEMVKVGVHLGGILKTFYGLSGLGDLVATCNSAQSRNHMAGERIALGATLAELEASHLTAEGIPTARAVYQLALQEGLELPICTEIYKVIYQDKSPQQALADLMGRDMKME